MAKWQSKKRFQMYLEMKDTMSFWFKTSDPFARRALEDHYNKLEREWYRLEYEDE